MKKKVLTLISVIFILLIISLIIYFSIYYKSEDVSEYFEDNLLKIEEIDSGYFLDGPGEEDVIIFYPGAKVEYTSYIPLLSQLAIEGVDTFLLKMPFNFAFFKQNAADDIIDNYNYKNYYLMGHSLGGVVAANYANKHDSVTGLILLASYSTKPIRNELSLLSIYGDQDKVLNINKYNSNKSNFPDNSKEIVIKGANHSGFGNYGEQKGDGTATITKEEQQEFTVKEILIYLSE